MEIDHLVWVHIRLNELFGHVLVHPWNGEDAPPAQWLHVYYAGWITGRYQN